ncbi:unnamed protein product [Dimorphilus gyrociliatus]|uniref:Uncharacterized protein n=1 Tax=Dimorphilus gyrociliatus TaxID=2664684 RepID=A0A7I8VGP6_9ANNE|nr:unnamed protein product [Dimorphilus gyrociliatus]
MTNRIGDEQERIKQERILDETVNELIVSIKEQKENILDEMDLFYSEKKFSLQQALSDVKRLQDLHENSTNPIICQNMEKMKKNFIYSTKNLLNKVAIYSMSEFAQTKNIGGIIKPIFEVPFKEELIELSKPITRVIATKIGFLALQNGCEIIEVKTKKCLISEKDEILDIYSTYEDNLAYIQYREGRFYCKEINLEYRQTEEVRLPKCKIDPLTVMFGVFRDNIIIRSCNSKETFIIERKTLCCETWSNKLHKMNRNFTYKVFNNGLYYIYNSSVICYDSDFKRSYKRKAVSCSINGHSMYSNIMNKILEGYKIIGHDDKLILFSKESTYYIQQDYMFKNKSLIDYKVTSENIIFCLMDRANSKKLYIQSFPHLYK